MDLKRLVAELDGWMHPELYRDHCPNGLQVEGEATVRRLLCGVSASEALIDRAIAWQAQAILVHHGYFWRGETPVITGRKARRLRKLLHHGISLIAYHLPLDVHPALGNNAQLAQRLGLVVEGQARVADTPGLLWYGQLPDALDREALAVHVHRELGRAPLCLGGRGDRPLRRIAWCTGAAQGFIDEALALGVDVYLSGEVSEPTYHSAIEGDILYIAAGHHATERYGVQALARQVRECLGIETDYFEDDNPV